jgi:hypothetical protein
LVTDQPACAHWGGLAWVSTVAAQPPAADAIDGVGWSACFLGGSVHAAAVTRRTRHIALTARELMSLVRPPALIRS